MKNLKLSNFFSSNNTKIKKIKIDKLKTNPKFKDLYSQEPEKVEAICKSIKENGLDPTQPIIILKDGTIIDGHSRFLAATKAELKEVYVIVKDGMDTETDILIYEEHLQLSRRNLTEAQKLLHLENLLNLKKKAQTEGKDVSDFTDESIAKKLDVSPRQIQKMREVENKATPEQLESIRSGEASLNQVHEEIKKAQGLSRKSPSTTKTKVKISPSNNNVTAIISLIEKHIPETTIPDNLKADLENFFKSKE